MSSWPYEKVPAQLLLTNPHHGQEKISLTSGNLQNYAGRPIQDSVQMPRAFSKSSGIVFLRHDSSRTELSTQFFLNNQ